MDVHKLFCYNSLVMAHVLDVVFVNFEIIYYVIDVKLMVQMFLKMLTSNGIY